MCVWRATLAHSVCPHRWVTRFNTDHPLLASDAGLAPQLCSVRDRARVYPRYSLVRRPLSNLSGPYFLHETAKRWEIGTISCQRSRLEAQTEHRWGGTRRRRAGSTWTSCPVSAAHLLGDLKRANEPKGLRSSAAADLKFELTRAPHRAQTQSTNIRT